MWTNGDGMMLWVMVETRVDRAVRCGHGEYQLEKRSAQEGHTLAPWPVDEALVVAL
jgi:hypothetical protein